MKKEIFGYLPTGEAVELYTLQNEVATLRIMTRGATVVSFVPYGVSIVGGYDTLDAYLLNDGSHQGALIGRVANRVANACFVMDGKRYHLPKNNGEACLHGGDGFDYRLFTVKEATDDAITLTYFSEDGEEGFPGALSVQVTYRLCDATLLIDYTAIPHAKTPIALTNHSYFNLDGFGADILSHTATIYADHYTEVDDALIPTGRHPSVRGTVFDFTTPKAIGRDVGPDFLGYDHNFVLNHSQKAELFGHTLSKAAEVDNGKLCLRVYTDQPGVQFYIANFLGGKPDFFGGIPRIKHGAFCLETQTEPNCINHGEGFYEKGQVYRHITVYAVEQLS